MKVTIDEEICRNSELTFNEVLCLLLIKNCDSIDNVIQDLLSKEALITIAPKRYAVTQRWDDVCSNIVLSSDNTVPSEDRIELLAKSLMELFPKGKKDGTSTYWRGNLKDTKLRLKKFFKLYGNKFTDEEIISATRRYVESFNGSYAYMRVLKYFIWKDARRIDSEGNGYVEEVSDLATFIENEDNNNNEWTSELK